VLNAVLGAVGEQLVTRAVPRELLTLVRSAARVPRALAQRGARLTALAGTQPPPAGAVLTPVVLVHGYLGTESIWTPLADSLRRAGYVNVFTLGYDSLSAGVPELAALLVDAVRTVLARTGRPDVHLVGHSLGGLVTRYAVQRLGLDAVTRSVVTVGTPHGGTALARLGPGPAAAQLRPGSVFLTRLPPLSDTRHVRWAVVHAGADLVAPPPHHGGHPVLRGYGHHSVLRAPGLAALVADHLASSEPVPRREPLPAGPPPLYQTRADVALSDQRPATVSVRAN
jgi:pimeloyl-ACP methyl ester carboxylesterase